MSTLPHTLFGLLIAFGVLSAGADAEWSHGVLFAGAGGLMVLFRPQEQLPRLWWGLAGGFVILSMASFLPAAWFGVPEWRLELERLAGKTSGLQALQARQAAEELGALAFTLVTGMWLAGQRLESPRGPALGFALGVAGYAVFSRICQDSGEVFGFFPNRNHSATLLAMGAVVGLGVSVQTLREKRWGFMALAVMAAGICVGAVLAWSISRAGLVLVAVGAIGWLALLGTGYLGKHAGKLLALSALAVVGGFLVSDTHLKGRLGDSVERLGAAIGAAEAAGAEDPPAVTEVDFRLPTWLDTLEMIGRVPWTGVGAGQFRHVFPQYRERTAVMGETRTIHPESDWLWLAAECGVPATLALAALVLAAAGGALRRARHGRVRSVRIACLTGALLVAFHGLFDVPGHRLPLAWAAAWLFSLSLPPRRETREEEVRVCRFARLGHRVAGAAIALAGMWLVLASEGQVGHPATFAGERAREQALRLYREDQALVATAIETGDEPPREDLLEQALDELRVAAARVPLDPELWRMRGSLALQFDDKQEVAKRAFAIERTLLPKVASVPLEQARAWGDFDPGEVRELWTEALRRADQAARDSAVRWSPERTLAAIQQAARGNPALERIADELRKESSHPGSSLEASPPGD